MIDIKILQCGHDKSGTYLLYKIVSGILKSNNCFSSFLGSSGIGYLIDKLYSQYKRYPEINRVDHIRIENDIWGLNFPNPNCRHIPVDMDLVLNNSSLIYTHEKPMTLSALHNRFSHRIYMLRDGRDVVNSMIHFLTDEVSLRLCPTYTINSPKALYSKLDYFQNLVQRWNEHIESYNLQKDFYLTVRFEELISNRKRVIDELSHYIGLFVDVYNLSEETSFNTMQKSAPQHLRKGKSGDWRSFFTDKHKEIFKQTAGESLIQLGYETSNDW
ncbi:sulfotransferase domain-containing protein [bacterium]|nr:sulfotransferase domain-containing protein [bacterium]